MWIFSIAIGVVLLYVGGWGLLWAEPTNIFTFGKEFYFGKDAIAIKVNNSFYGLSLSKRFFDSYAISMALLGAAFACIFGGGAVNNKNES